MLASPHPSPTGTTGGFSGGHGQSGTGLGGRLLERDISGAAQEKFVFSKDCCLQIPPASPLSATWLRLSPCEMLGKMPAGKAGSQTSLLLPPAGSGRAGRGVPQGSPDVVLELSEKDLQDLVLGELRPLSAYMSGRLQVRGDLHLALKLEELFKAMKQRR